MYAVAEEAQEFAVAPRAREAEVEAWDRDLLAMDLPEAMVAMADARALWRLAALDHDSGEAEVVQECVAHGMSITSGKTRAMADPEIRELRRMTIRWEHRFLIAEAHVERLQRLLSKAP